MGLEGFVPVVGYEGRYLVDRCGNVFAVEIEE